MENLDNKLVISRTTRKVKFSRIAIRVFLNNVDLKKFEFVNDKYVYNQRVNDRFKNYSEVNISMNKDKMDFLLSKHGILIKDKVITLYRLPDSKFNLKIYKKVEKPGFGYMTGVKCELKITGLKTEEGITFKFDTYITSRTLINLFEKGGHDDIIGNDTTVYFDNKHAAGKIINKF